MSQPKVRSAKTKSTKSPQKSASKSSGGVKPARTSKLRAAPKRSLDITADFSGYGVKAGGTLKYRNAQNNNNSPTYGPVICKEEVVGDVLCGSTGQTIIAPVHTFQPGMETMFSWASGQCAGYQRYRVRRAAYRFAPYVGVFSDQGKNGKLILYFSYDVNSPLPLDSATAENSKPSLAKMITEWKTENILHLDPMYMQDTQARSKLVRTVDPPDTYALRDFDAGKLILVTTDFTTSGKIGTLYVQYEIELLIPQPVPDPAAFQISRTLDSFSIGYTGAQATAQLTGVTVGSTAVKWNTDAFSAGNVTVDTAGVFSIQGGYYLVMITIQIGDPTNTGNAIGNGASYLTFNPGGAQSEIFGQGVVGSNARGYKYSHSKAVMSTSTGNTSVYLSQYSLASFAIAGPQGYYANFTFLSCS